MMTYWFKSPRGFQNEYSIGIATGPAHAKNYKAEGYDRITRKQALRDLSNQGDDATRIYADVTVDGGTGYDRRDIARCIRTGIPISQAYW